MCALCDLLEAGPGPRTSLSLSAAEAAQVAEAVQSAGRAVWHMLLWSTRDVYLIARDRDRLEQDGGRRGEDEEDSGEEDQRVSWLACVI